jgi:hypothetical protein
MFTMIEEKKTSTTHTGPEIDEGESGMAEPNQKLDES